MDSGGDQNKVVCNHYNDKVTSLGNAWVICRSKSYSGRVYYFNTLTGEAAWNLSDAEVEKAKRQTNSVRLHAVSHLDNCPEPKEPPMDHHNYNRIAGGNTKPDHISPQIYNKQIINNRFTKSAHTPYVPCQCNSCNPFQSVMPGFNPNVWSIPTQPYFVAPNVSSIPQQSQAPINIPCHNMQHDVIQKNASFPHPGHGLGCTRGRNFQNRYHGPTHFSPRGNRIHFGPRRGQFVPRWPKHQNYACDLRNILSSRKSMENDHEDHGNDFQDSNNINNDAAENSNDVPLPTCNKQELSTENEDDQWLMESCTCENGKFKIDVTALKKLATKDAESETWYIVVDKNMVLDHFNVLHVFINSDRQCRLVVARDVLSQLQTTARAGAAPLKERARRALRFLSQQFAANSALIGEHSINANEMNEGTGMINFCLKLVEQNNHVILLSDNELLQTDKQNNVVIFTLNEMKEFLTNGLYREGYFKSSPIPDRTITVTIPNEQANISKDEEMETTTMEIPEVQNNNFNLNLPRTRESNVQTEVQNNNFNLNLPRTRESNVQTDGLLKTKKTVDTAVQTDFTLVELTQNFSITKPNVEVETIQGRSETIIRENTNSNLNTELNNANAGLNSTQNTAATETTTTENSKKREIRLNRSTSNQASKSADNNIGKKQFKWHRRKKYGSCSDNAVSMNATVDNDEPREMLLKLKQNPLAMSSESLSKNVNVYDDVIDNSDTSSCIYMHRNVTQNIIIEETSTSDVISNSASIDNSEVVRELPIEYNNVTNDTIDTEQSKNVMFEITSPAMEKYLHTRRDEWMSRFVQIMEEVLTQILRNEMQFFDSSLPPPWTLHEATQCIKKSFSYDSDINDATTKLAEVIFSISDKKGRLSVDVTPAKFMELYSYGVYLVDALQSIFEECVDLHAAAESLATLLSDIQSPNSGHNDSFCDQSDEPSLVVSLSSNEGYKENQNLFVNDKTAQETIVYKSPGSVNKTKSPQGLHPITPKKAQNVSSDKIQNISPGRTQSTPLSKRRIDQSSSTDDGKYNLRSNKKRSEPEVSRIKENNQKESNKKIISAKETNLKEVSQNEVTQSEGGVRFIRNIDIQGEFFANLRLKRNNLNNAKQMGFFEQNLNQTALGTNKEKKDSTKEPCIIRNFSKCLDIEERLKSKGRKALDLDMLDYSMNYDDDYDFMEHQDMEEGEDETDEIIPNTYIDMNQNYQLLVLSVMKAIREATIKVHSFCEKVYNELSHTEVLDSEKKQGINEQVENTRLHVTSLCNSLKGILQRELKQNGKSCQTLLREVGVSIDDSHAYEYTTVVASWISQANTLLEALNVIKDAVKSTNGAILE